MNKPMSAQQFIARRKAGPPLSDTVTAPASTAPASPPTNPVVARVKQPLRTARWRLVVDYDLDAKPSLRLYLPHYTTALRETERALRESLAYVHTKMDVDPELAKDETMMALLVRYDEAIEYIGKRIRTKRKATPWSINIGNAKFSLTSMQQ